MWKENDGLNLYLLIDLKKHPMSIFKSRVFILQRKDMIDFETYLITKKR